MDQFCQVMAEQKYHQLLNEAEKRSRHQVSDMKPVETRPERILFLLPLRRFLGWA